MTNNFSEKANFIWTVADDILRGAFKAHEYGDVILPFVVLRRLDLVLEPKKDDVIKQFDQFKKSLDEERMIPVLRQAAGGINFYNHSFYDLRRLAQDSKNIELNFGNYLNGYSKNVREIIENFQLEKILTKLSKNDLLYQLVEKFAEVDLSPASVTNHEMGYIFEELLRRFSEMSNETAGEHYTPREVIRLMVSLMFAEHKKDLKGKGIIRTVFDPACGTGGMLITAKDYIHSEINADLEVVMYGQELNEQTYAIAKSDVLIMGENAENIRDKSSFSEDKFKGQQFSYMLSNPPFGVSWKKEQVFIENEANDPHGRFSAGTPRTSDGALLFLQHMISKMEAGGSRIAVIFNGSPLFTGDAGGGDSNIRKWIIENDWLEAIVVMPSEMFYNTGITTYIWIVTNRKPSHRKGKVQLINAVDFFTPMSKSLGNKRKYFTDDHIRDITKIYTDFTESNLSKILDNEDFGYTKVTVERPTYNSKGKVEKDKSGQPKPDVSLRSFEKIPLKVNIDTYFEQEIKPHVHDAWLERSKDKVGYEISITKYFYEYQPLRLMAKVKEDILKLESETEGLSENILHAKQTSLIANAVTKGLNPNVSMKDSGVKWIGTIPSHWAMTRVGRAMELGRGRVISNIEIGENQGEYPVYSSQTSENGVMGYINTYDFEGDYVTWTTDGANAGTVFYRTGKFNCTNVCGTLKPKIDGIHLPYISHLLNQGTKYYVRYDINPKLMNGEMAQIEICLPPLSEQIAITNYIDSQVQTIDNLIKQLSKQIELYEEYRASLISESATGKIDVR